MMYYDNSVIFIFANVEHSKTFSICFFVKYVRKQRDEKLLMSSN